MMSAWSRFAWLSGRHHPPLRLIERLAEPLDDMIQVLFQDATAGVLIVDRDGLIVRANDRLREMLGPLVDVSRGQAAAVIFAAPDRDEVCKELAPALAGSRPPRVFAARLDSPGDGDQSVDVSGVALCEADHTVSGLILRLADVTVQKQLEAQLAQSQKLQALGQLAGGIAHDFNNLLTATIGAADLIAGRLGVDAETLEDVAQIRRSADRGADLVRQLLAFGRQQALLPKVVPINAAIGDMALLLRRLLNRGVKLELDLETPEPTVLVDPTQLDQVLLNLAVNGRDAMPDGGTLTVRSGHMILSRAVTRGTEVIAPGRYVMIEVQDTGVGIAADVLPRIFDPFFTTRRDHGGGGLGLSTVHGIVRQSDGFLAVESEVGHGTRLRVYLPQYESGEAVTIPKLPVTTLPIARLPVATLPVARPLVELPVPAKPTPEPAVVLPSRTLLLVDDEASVVRLAERALRQHGWQVLAAESAEKALALLDERDAAGERAGLGLLITDVVMPGMDGPSLVRKIRERWPELPAILVSGYPHDMMQRNTVPDNITFLSKPYTLKSLLANAEAIVARAGVETPP